MPIFETGSVFASQYLVRQVQHNQVGLTEPLSSMPPIKHGRFNPRIKSPGANGIPFRLTINVSRKTSLDLEGKS